MIKNTPPMGWNSWNTFGHEISDQLIRDTADKLVETGLAACGYEYVVIDDCWALRERDENGRLVPDPAKFPHGIKALADYVHSKGLKFGIYSCAGNLTCAGFPGSYEHEFTDAATFAEWGVDFLKYDYCYHSDIVHGKYLYRRMGLALKNCGRDILFSACSWGSDGTPEWIRETGANMWRSTGDVFDTWESVKDIIQKQEAMLPYGGIGSFNDMDMMVVGMRGRGNVGMDGLNDTQYRTHFAVWALFGSPLFIGCDVREMDDFTLSLLKNKPLIAINQDADCRQVITVTSSWDLENNPVHCYARMLENGDIAVGFFNFIDRGLNAWLSLDKLGLPGSTGKTLEMHDVFTGEVITVTNGTFRRPMQGYDSLVYRCRVVDKA